MKSKNEEIKSKNEEMKSKNEEIKSKNDEIKSKNDEIKRKKQQQKPQRRWISQRSISMSLRKSMERRLMRTGKDIKKKETLSRSED